MLASGSTPAGSDGQSKRRAVASLVALGGLAAIMMLATDHWLSQTMLPYALATRRDLRGSRFRGARIRTGATFAGRNLSGSLLSGGVFRGIDARRAVLRDADLSRSAFRESDFARANLRGVDLRGSHFVHCDFASTDLRGARLMDARFVGCRFEATDFGAADLSRCWFSQCRFIGTDLAASTGGKPSLKHNLCDRATRWKPDWPSNGGDDMVVPRPGSTEWAWLHAGPIRVGAGTR